MTAVTVRSASEWADACSRAFVPLAVHGAAPRFTATLEQVSLASGVSVTRVSSGGSVVSRAAGVLQVPRRVVTRTGHGFDDLTAKVLPPSASLTALTGLMGAVASAGGPARVPAEDDLLADAALTLLRGMLLPTGHPPTTRIDRYALDTALRAYVEEHLTDPGLTVDRLAASHYVSVRPVHKIFSESGETSAAYVRRKRLARARSLLLDGAVTAAAVRTGFTATDTFARAFTRRYGVPPSDLRA